MTVIAHVSCLPANLHIYILGVVVHTLDRGLPFGRLRVTVRFVVLVF